jgi:hypothetical protein
MDVDLDNPGLAAWVEAALRLGEPASVEEKLAAWSSGSQALPARVVAMHGMAKLMMGQIEQAIDSFDQVIARMRRAWPSRDKMPAEHWALLTALVPDVESQERVKSYFDARESKE